MLLDEFFPAFDACERHTMQVAASPAVVYAALRTADLSGHPVTRLLLALRALPAVLARRRPAPATSAATPRRVTLADFERHGFVVLAENPPDELLLGLQGRFWTMTGNLERLDPGMARGPVPPGQARAGWNFVATPQGGGTLLSTETRVVCGDAEARRRFRWYWRLVRPGSGIIRRAMLASVRRAAEAAQGP